MNDNSNTNDQRHEEIVRVPLRPNTGRYATIHREDYEMLRKQGVGDAWFVVKAGKYEYVRGYCRGATGDQITIARAILGAGRRGAVRYVTRDRMDLTRGNLRLGRGSGKRSDTTLLSNAAASSSGAAA